MPNFVENEKNIEELKTHTTSKGINQFSKFISIISSFINKCEKMNYFGKNLWLNKWIKICAKHIILVSSNLWKFNMYHKHGYIFPKLSINFFSNSI